MYTKQHYSTSRPTKRQTEQRKQLLKNNYFLVKWADEDHVYNVLSYKDLQMDSDLLECVTGFCTKARFQGRTFDVEIVASGGKSKKRSISQTDDTQAGKSKKRKLSHNEGLSSVNTEQNIQVGKKGKPFPKKDRGESLSAKIDQDFQVGKSKKHSPKKDGGAVKTVRRPKKNGSPKKSKEKSSSQKPANRSPKKKAKELNENLRASATIFSKLDGSGDQESPSVASVPVSAHDKAVCNISEGGGDGGVSRSLEGTVIDALSSSRFMSCTDNPPGFCLDSAYEDVVYDGLDTMTEGSMSETPNNSFELSSSTPKSSGLFHATRPSYNTYQQWDQKDPLTRPFLMPPPTHPPDNMAFQLNMFQQTLQQMSSQLQSVTSDVSNIKKKLDRKRKREKEYVVSDSDTSLADAAVPPATGCVLGNPALSTRVTLKSPSQSIINSATAEAKGETKLALKLLSVLFTRAEIADGICTIGGESSGRKLLDQEKIQGIRVHVNYMYPKDPQEEQDRWHRLLHGNLNNKCRNTRNNQKKAEGC